MARVLGIDGAKGGWVFATLSPQLQLHFSASIDTFWTTHASHFDCILIDMIMGLPSSPSMLRPESQLHELLRHHSASIFRVPCRQAVYANDKAEMYRIHEQVMQQKLTPFSINLIPKIKELDQWLQHHQEITSILYESHPESAFHLLKGQRLQHSKHTTDGLQERFRLLCQWLPDLCFDDLTHFSIANHVKLDDVLDAIVLAYTAQLHLQGHTQMIPPHPEVDECGIRMSAIVPLRTKTPS